MRFKTNEINDSRAALFKGLGFNSIEIQVNQTSPADIRQISRALEIANDFHFSLCGLRLTDLKSELNSEVIQLISGSHRRPDSITIADFPHTQENGVIFKALFKRLRESGYRVIGNDCFVDSKHCLAQAQAQGTLKLSSHGYNCQNVSDILGIGPGNFSSCGNNRHFNPTEMQSYMTHDFTNRQNPPFLSHSVKPVLDHLLCYHHLDLKYFRDRYGWDLATLIDQLWSPLQTAQKPFFKISNKNLSLSPEGILNLSMLCEVLLRNTEKIIAPLPAQPCVGK